VKEVRLFEIRKKIKDKESGEIIHLYKKEPLEIDWKDGWGSVLGEEAQQEMKDGTWYSINIGEPVIFEKGGKKYEVFVKINEIRRGFWGDNPSDYSFFIFPNRPYRAFHGREEVHIWEVRLVNGGWRVGRIIFAFSVFVIFSGLVLVWFLWKRSK